jgi:2-polyprenyl-3-methyl-5-hydroxy-6-metoxy-1,4-benzoquinol methylase
MKLNKILSKTKWLILLIVLLVALLYVKTIRKWIYEGFTNIEDRTEVDFSSYKVHSDVESIFDDFYCRIYDHLFYEEPRNIFEMQELETYTNLKKNSVILDVGCGTGNQSYMLHDRKYNVLGVDKSKAMINYCKKQYPEQKFQHGDVSEGVLYDDERFTHVLCYYFTIYYIKNKRQFFENCMHWLEPGGYLVIHLVNRNKFDPIVPIGNPLEFVNPQRHAKERMTKTDVIFKKFNYKAYFDLKGDKAYFIEEFRDKKNRGMRKHVHELFMDSQQDIINMAKEIGFIVKAKSNMVRCGYEYQYLYFLQKPLK